MLNGASILLFMPSVSEIDLSDFKTQHVTAYQEASEMIQSSLPDVIIAASTPDTNNLFSSIRATVPEPTCPLLLLPPGDNGNCLHLADALLTPAAVNAQIASLLRMRARQIELFRQNQRLAEENQQLKTALLREQKLKSEIEILKNAIVRNVSHELKTPLLQVKSAVSLLAEDVKDTKLIDYATGATARLEALVKNITMLGGSLEISLNPVIIRESVEYARRNLRRIWEHRDQTTRVKIDLPHNLPPVMADKQGLSTVLQLLMDNALKFSKDDIEVFARHENDHVTVFVRDYGIGIAPDQLHAIFDTFYQVDGSSTRRYGGMGIGLALARLILDSHNTRIHVDSVLNQGSTFSFTLPIVDF